MSSCRSVVAMEKTCQSCGAQFPCGLSCCWCDEVALAPDLAAALRARFSDCLCRSCLLAAIDGSRDAARSASSDAPGVPSAVTP